MRKYSIIELIKYALDRIRQTLNRNLYHFEEKEFNRLWRYEKDSIELKISIESISEAGLKRFSREKRIKSIIKQIKGYNNDISTFKETLTNIIEKSRKTFGFTPEELFHSQTTDELKWKYVQWTIGDIIRNIIHVPQDALDTFYERTLFRRLQKNGKTELDIFEGKVKSQDNLKRIKDDIKQSTEDDVIKLKDISEDLEKKTKEFMESIESVIAYYKNEYCITERELAEYKLPKKPDISVEL